MKLFENMQYNTWYKKFAYFPVKIGYGWYWWIDYWELKDAWGWGFCDTYRALKVPKEKKLSHEDIRRRF